MSTPTGPSFFVDIYGCTWTPNGGGSGSVINIYAIKSINISRDRAIVKGMDNNKLRPVAVHTVAISDTVTIDTEDFNAIDAVLFADASPGTLVYNGRAAAHNSVGANQLADQTVTITNFVFDKDSMQSPSKAIGSYKMSGFTLENSAGDGTDPITITTATGAPSDAAN